MNAAIVTEQKRLKYVATINDESLSEATEPNYELQYIDIGNVDSYGIVHDIVAYKFEDAPSRARRIVRHGDVIVSTVRTYLQAIAPIENPPENLIVSTGFAVVRPRENLFDARFCKYAMREKHFLWEVESRSTGVSYPAINSSDLADIRISLPNLETQRLIADYLDRETGCIDALVAEKEKMLALLEEKRAALISRVVTRGLDPNAPLKPSGLDWLGEIPEHWEVTRFKYVCDLNPTIDLSRLAEDDKVTFLPMDRIKKGYYIENTELFSKYNSSYNPFLEGDIIIAKVTPCFENGNIAIAENLQNRVGFGRSEIFVIRPVAAQQRFIFYYLQSAYFKQQGEASMAGAGGLKRVSPEFVRDHFIGLPSADEQVAIANFLDQQQSRMQMAAQTISETIILLQERRAALITAAVTGRIPVEEMTA